MKEILVLYPVIAALLRASREERYAWPGALGAGLLTGYLVTSHGDSTLLLGGVLAGLLAGDRFKGTPERVAVALVFLMVIYYGAHPVGLLPLAAFAVAAGLDETMRPKGYYLLTNAVLLGCVGLGLLDPWTAVAFLIGEGVYTYRYEKIGKKKRRYPGFRRRG